MVFTVLPSQLTLKSEVKTNEKQPTQKNGKNGDQIQICCTSQQESVNRFTF